MHVPSHSDARNTLHMLLGSTSDAGFSFLARFARLATLLAVSWLVIYLATHYTKMMVL
jgi:hypothetical protein